MCDKNAYCAALAALLFPEYQDEAGGAEDYEALYPQRALPAGAAVTRLGPSPTGFIHLGNLFMATVNQCLAAQTGGVFFLRVEDTDQKREVAGAVGSLIRSLAYFGVAAGEGVMLAGEAPEKEPCLGKDEAVERGAYGSYFQSKRRAIYRAFARRLVLEGKAYPCFLTEEELESIRSRQETEKLQPGIYGKFASWRGAAPALVEKKLLEEAPYVLRFYADYADAELSEGQKDTSGEKEDAAAGSRTITVVDGIRGAITMPENRMDVVVLKRDGLPTYHFAHVIDDHLMRTTHVVRGEEWLSSLPVHMALFQALGFQPPTYCHTALLMKLDDGVKRKLSKRKDPELALSYYIADGYHPAAVREYLLTIINSNYEEWRLSNPELDSSEFFLATEKMGASGILFDLDKLRNISRDTLARISAPALADFMLAWAAREKPDVYAVLLRERALLEKALDIGRSGEKPRKDLVYAAQMLEAISYFFDEYFCFEEPLPENVPEEEARILLDGYLSVYEHTDDREQWFEKIRVLSASQGYAAKPKDFKNNPELYKGHVGDVSTVIRRALTGRRNAPDIYEIQQILGETRVRMRLAFTEKL